PPSSHSSDLIGQEAHRGHPPLSEPTELHSVCKIVFKFVRMISFVDGDVHGAAEAGQLAGSGVWDHDDVQVGRSASHGRVVLQYETAAAIVQCAGNSFDRDISGRTLRVGARAQHFSLTDADEIAVELLVD